MKIKRIKVGPLKTNCYLIISNKEMAIIDPGDELEKILKEIQKTKAKVKYIILTHYHFDHTLAAEKLKEKTGAKILIHKGEKNFINFLVNQYLKDSDKIKIDQESLKIIHTPGHTKGSICLLGENLIFTGDTIFENGYGRTDLPGGSKKDLKNSLKKLKKLLGKETTVYPGHGEMFKIKN